MAAKIIPPNFVPQKPAYLDILNEDYPPGLTPKQLVEEIHKRNARVRLAKAIEKEILKALEAGKLPEFELRVARRAAGLLKASKTSDIVESKTKRARKSSKKPKASHKR